MDNTPQTKDSNLQFSYWKVAGQTMKRRLIHLSADMFIPSYTIQLRSMVCGESESVTSDAIPRQAIPMSFDSEADIDGGGGVAKYDDKHDDDSDSDTMEQVE